MIINVFFQAEPCSNNSSSAILWVLVKRAFCKFWLYWTHFHCMCFIVFEIIASWKRPNNIKYQLLLSLFSEGDWEGDCLEGDEYKSWEKKLKVMSSKSPSAARRKPLLQMSQKKQIKGQILCISHLIGFVIVTMKQWWTSQP